MPNRLPKRQTDRLAEPAASSKFHRELADFSPHMLWAARPDGTVDYFNARVFDYTGLTQRQLEGWGWRSVVHPEDWEHCLKRWTKAFKTGHPYEVEYRLRRRDGRYFWHLGAAMPQRDAGRVLRWFGSCTEIENQKRAERLLAKARESISALVGRGVEERLRSVIALSSDFFWETDAGHRLCMLEAGGRADSFNFAPVRLGRTRWEIPSVAPDAEGWRRHRKTLDARQAFRDFEIARKDDAGVVRHFSIDGGPFFDAGGRFLGYRGVGREITARKLAAQALRDGDRRVQAFLESIPGVAWIKDSKMRYVWVSANYERILGKSLESMLGRDAFEVWPKETAERYRLANEKALRVNGAIHDVVETTLRDGGTARWTVVRFPYPDETGALGVAGVAFELADLSVGHAHAKDDDSALERLSGRELQVLRMIVEGLTSSDVAERLGLSPKSVDTYRSRLMAKLEIDSLPALVKFALRHGLTGRR